LGEDDQNAASKHSNANKDEESHIESVLAKSKENKEGAPLENWKPEDKTPKGPEEDEEVNVDGENEESGYIVGGPRGKFQIQIS